MGETSEMMRDGFGNLQGQREKIQEADYHVSICL